MEKTKEDLERLEKYFDEQVKEIELSLDDITLDESQKSLIKGNLRIVYLDGKIDYLKELISKSENEKS